MRGLLLAGMMMVFGSATAGGTDQLVITWPGGTGIVYTGTIQSVIEDGKGGRVYFMSDDPPELFGSGRVMATGTDEGVWHWAIFTRPGPVLGSGNCTMLRDETTVILDCAGSGVVGGL